jgi:hypothetical protein
LLLKPKGLGQLGATPTYAVILEVKYYVNSFLDAVMVNRRHFEGQGYCSSIIPL